MFQFGFTASVSSAEKRSHSGVFFFVLNLSTSSMMIWRRICSSATNPPSSSSTCSRCLYPFSFFLFKRWSLCMLSQGQRGSYSTAAPVALNEQDNIFINLLLTSSEGKVFLNQVPLSQPPMTQLLWTPLHCLLSQSDRTCVKITALKTCHSSPERCIRLESWLRWPLNHFYKYVDR